MRGTRLESGNGGTEYLQLAVIPRWNAATCRSLPPICRTLPDYFDSQFDSHFHMHRTFKEGVPSVVETSFEEKRKVMAPGAPIGYDRG